MLAAWGPHSALGRAGGPVAQARFPAGGGLGAPCRLLLGAPDLPLQMTNGLWWPSACERAQFIGRRLVCSVLVLLRVCNDCGLQQNVSASDMFMWSIRDTPAHPARCELGLTRNRALHPARIELATFSMLG